jgi:hypothetical protein
MVQRPTSFRSNHPIALTPRFENLAGRLFNSASSDLLSRNNLVYLIRSDPAWVKAFTIGKGIGRGIMRIALPYFGVMLCLSITVWLIVERLG